MAVRSAALVGGALLAALFTSGCMAVEENPLDVNSPRSQENVSVRRLGEAGDLQAFLAVDIKFHQLLLRSCGNEMFMALEGMVAEVLTSRTKQGLMPFKPRNEALQAHEDVAAAVAGGDTVVAERAMHHILNEVREAMGLH